MQEMPKDEINVAFVGSREFHPLAIIHQVMERVGRCRVISGGARGVDRYVEQFADLLGYPKKIFEADWNKYGKSAGPKRNYEMVQESDIAMVFWDGTSRGTRDFMNKAIKKGIPMIVFEVSGKPKALNITRYHTREFEDSNGQLELSQIKNKSSEGNSSRDVGATEKGSE